MSRSLVKEALAERDLVNLWCASYERWGIEQADRYLDQIHAALEPLLKNPELGRDRGAIRPGYRSVVVGAHVVFYTFTVEELRVRRVLHGAQDLDLHL